MGNKCDYLILIVFENVFSLPSSPFFGLLGFFFYISCAFLGIKAVFLMYSFFMQMVQNMFMKYSFIEIALKYLYMQNTDGLYQSPLPPRLPWEDVRLGVK